MTRVTRNQADRTNQKLYFTRYFCTQAKQSSKKNMQWMARETAILHLYGAYIAYLQELVSYYKLPITKPSLQSIEAALAKRTQVSPEVAVLKPALEAGFLAELVRAYQHCMYAPKQRASANTDNMSDSSQLIFKVTSSELSWLPEEEIILEWYNKFNTLIESFREAMVEF